MSDPKLSRARIQQEKIAAAMAASIRRIQSAATGLSKKKTEVVCSVFGAALGMLVGFGVGSLCGMSYWNVVALMTLTGTVGLPGGILTFRSILVSRASSPAKSSENLTRAIKQLEAEQQKLATDLLNTAENDSVSRRLLSEAIRQRAIKVETLNERWHELMRARPELPEVREITVDLLPAAPKTSRGRARLENPQPAVRLDNPAAPAEPP